MKAWYWLAVTVLSLAAAFMGLLLLLVASGKARLVSGPPAVARQEAPLSAAELAYIARTMERLDAKADPVIIRQFDPALKPARIVPGDVGTLPPAEVVQIHGEADFLGQCDGVSLWIAGIDTRQTADGRLLSLAGHVFYCAGNRTYLTVTGAPRTVMEVRAFDATRARRLALARLDREIERRKGWKVVYELQGTATQETKPFTLHGRRLRLCWEWTSTETDRGGSMLVNLHDGKGNAVVLDACEAPRGARPFERAGTSQLSVAAFARDYRVWIESWE